MPGYNFVGHGFGDPRDQFGRYGHPEEVFDMRLDVAVLMPLGYMEMIL